MKTNRKCLPWLFLVCFVFTAGKSAVLRISTSPKLSQKTISYKSLKPSVVSVSRKEKMTAKKAGISKISITVKSSGYKNKTASVM